MTAPTSFDYGPTGDYQALPVPDAYLEQLAITLVIVAVGLLVVALTRRIPAWSGWLAPALAIPAILIEFSTLSIDGGAEPELLGVAIALPAVVASVTWWWLRRPEATPTWQTIAPPFVLAVLPSTIATFDDATGRWWFDDHPGTAYQVRVVALSAVGVIAAVIGARQRWSGLFLPGLALTLVVAAIQLADLGRFLPQWVTFGVAGALLLTAGARWEWLRAHGREGVAWVRALH